MDCDVRDLGLAERGRERIEWAGARCAVLRLIRERFEKERPLEGIRIGGVPARDDGDGEPRRDPRGRRRRGVRCARRTRCPRRTTSRRRSASRTASRSSRSRARTTRRTTGTSTRCSTTHPQVTMDDGADLVSRPAQGAPRPAPRGHRRDRGDDDRRHPPPGDGGGRACSRYPIVAVNDADTKHLFDNRFGTGQSTIDGIMRATNFLWPGGRSWCAATACAAAASRRGRAGSAPGSSSPRSPRSRRWRPSMEGYQVMPLRRPRAIGDIFVTVTGDTACSGASTWRSMKDGAVLANSGHFDVEIDKAALEALSTEVRAASATSSTSTGWRTGGSIYLLARGAAREPLRRGGASGRGDGHVVREPGAGRGVGREERRRPEAGGLRGAGRDRRTRSHG